MSAAWAGGTDAIIERIDKMTALFIEEARKSIYTGESAINCEECGDPIPESRRKAVSGTFANWRMINIVITELLMECISFMACVNSN